MKKDKHLRDTEVDQHIKAVTKQMKQLQSDLFDLYPLLTNLDEHQREKYTKSLNLLRPFLNDIPS
jgi:MerR family transcriptional regulator, copper efflux regulator